MFTWITNKINKIYPIFDNDNGYENLDDISNKPDKNILRIYFFQNIHLHP